MGLNREAGEIPARSRRCNRGRSRPSHYLKGWEGTWRGRSGSQKTCSGLVDTSFSARTEAGGRTGRCLRVFLAIGSLGETCTKYLTQSELAVSMKSHRQWLGIHSQGATSVHVMQGYLPISHACSWSMRHLRTASNLEARFDALTKPFRQNVDLCAIYRLMGLAS